MLRKLAIWLLLIPLPLNGLWLVCRDAPPKVPEPAASSADSERNLLEFFANAEADSESGANCVKICAIKSAEKDGSFCLVSGGSKTSLTIIVFGVAILPPALQLHPVAAVRQFIAELPDLYLSPFMGRSTPPPRA